MSGRGGVAESGDCRHSERDAPLWSRRRIGTSVRLAVGPFCPINPKAGFPYYGLENCYYIIFGYVYALDNIPCATHHGGAEQGGVASGSCGHTSHTQHPCKPTYLLDVSYHELETWKLVAYI
jgi:hypothetical protein